MRKIINFGTYSQIVDEENFEVLSDLDKFLSFRVPGAEYSRAFKGFVDKSGKFQRWDGTKRILTKDLKFGTGLTTRIVDFYKSRDLEVEMVDKRQPKSLPTPIDIDARLQQLDKVPYDYQLGILPITAVEDRGIIKSATGSGKSLIAALITAQFGKKAAVYVIGKDLLYQFYELFKDIFGDRAGIVGDGHCKIGDFNIVSIWTVGQALGLKKGDLLLDADDSDEKLDITKKGEIVAMMGDTKVHIIDECHMAACNTIQEIYKHTKNAEHMYGLSGSPWRDDNADLLVEAILGRYIVDIPASYLIRRGFLAQPIIRFMEVPPLVEKPANNYQVIYKKYIVDNAVRNDMVLKAARQLTQQGYQTLILFNSIAHGKALHRLISSEIECAILDGSDSQVNRNDVKQRLLKGELRCVLASKIFDIGVDIPSLSGLVIACGGKSTVKAIQRVGRVIRRYPGKKYAAIIDFADNCKFLDKHSKIRHKIYKSEDGFDVQWVIKKKK